MSHKICNSPLAVRYGTWSLDEGQLIFTHVSGLLERLQTVRHLLPYEKMDMFGPIQSLEQSALNTA